MHGADMTRLLFRAACVGLIAFWLLRWLGDAVWVALLFAWAAALSSPFAAVAVEEVLRVLRLRRGRRLLRGRPPSDHWEE